MKYECKENDCLIEMGKDESEILISVKGETAKTIIGLKDLNEALILFGVVKSLPTIESIIIDPLQTYLEKTGSFTKAQSENIAKNFYNYVDDYDIDLGI